MSITELGAPPAQHSDGGDGAGSASTARTLLARALGRRAVLRNALLLALVAEVVVFFLFSADFLTVGNLTDIGLESSVIALVSVPFALLLLTGYIDLSVGSVLGLAAVITGLLLNHGTSPVLAVLAGIGVGTVIGLINGLLCAVMGFSSIIVTLGGLTALRGVALQASTATPTNFGASFDAIGNGSIAGVPTPVIIAAAALLIGGAILRFTAWGRHIYAIGINREAAFLSGLSIRRLPLILFVATGAAAALGGIIQAARLDAAPGSTLGVGFELNVLTAVLLGGVSFGGGRGKLFGVFLGVAFLGILQNGLTLLNVSLPVTDVAQGLVLVVAGGLEYLNHRAENS